MKLIESSAKYIPQEDGLQGIYKQIERAGRICYKSEDKITDDSAEEFVKRMISSGHLAMLEHGTVYLKIDIPVKNPYRIDCYIDNRHTNRVFVNMNNGFYCITTNFRTLVDNKWTDDLQYLVEPTNIHKKRYTFKLVTSIGIVRELLRHRVFSFANESTRYCNYSKDKFNNEITFIIPSYYGSMDIFHKERFTESLSTFEEEYFNMLKAGYTPQQARELLPLCTKSELIMTGFKSDWDHFFDLRLYGKTGEPHPDMKILAQKIRDEFDKYNL